MQTLVNLLRDFFEDSVSREARVRKVQRDLKGLIQDGQVVIEDKTAHTYRFLASSSQYGIDKVSWEYLVKNIEKFISSVAPSKRLDVALKKLHANEVGFSLDESIFQVAPDTLPLISAQFNPVVLSTILRSLTMRKAIKAKYRYRDNTLGDLVLHPQGAIQSGPRFFLYVLVGDEEDYVQVYALHRFISVEILNEPARKAPYFDLSKAVEARDSNPNESQKIKVEILTRRFVTDLLRDCPLSDDQEIVDEYRYPGFDARVTATVTDSLLLERWLMGRGTSLCVITPRGLANRIAANGIKIAQMHAAPPRMR